MEDQEDFYCLHLSHPQQSWRLPVSQLKPLSLSRSRGAACIPNIKDFFCNHVILSKGKVINYHSAVSKDKNDVGQNCARFSSLDVNCLVEYINGTISLFYISDMFNKDIQHYRAAMSSGVHNSNFRTPIAYSALIIRMDGYLLSHLMNILESSATYRLKFYKNYFQNLYYYDKVDGTSNGKTRPLLSILISVKLPVRHYLDPIGSNISNVMLHEKSELDCALSWLSTLGGAFSSLGEMSLFWATSAAENSFKQLKLAIRLNDPLITSRCKIYIALSLIQRGRLHLARQILENENRFYYSLLPGIDNRLGKMCKGVWHKLKYEWDLKIQRKRLKSVTINN